MADDSDRTRLSRIRVRQAFILRLWLSSSAMAVLCSFVGLSRLVTMLLTIAALVNFGIWFALTWFEYDLSTQIVEQELDE